VLRRCWSDDRKGIGSVNKAAAAIRRLVLPWEPDLTWSNSGKVGRLNKNYINAEHGGISARPRFLQIFVLLTLSSSASPSSSKFIWFAVCECVNSISQATVPVSNDCWPGTFRHRIAKTRMSSNSAKSTGDRRQAKRRKSQIQKNTHDASEQWRRKTANMQTR